MEAPLQVSYSHGRPFAAYYHLPRREGERVVWSRPCEGGLVVDLSADGSPMGIEITDPSVFDLATVNRLMVSLGLEAVDSEVLAPLDAA